MSPKAKTVLIVDDDEGMRDTLGAILKVREDEQLVRGAGLEELVAAAAESR